MSFRFNFSGPSRPEEPCQFLDRIRLLHRGRRITPGNPATINRDPCIRQRQVQWMPHQIIDQDGDPRNPQRFAGKLQDFLWRKVVKKQCA